MNLVLFLRIFLITVTCALIAIVSVIIIKYRRLLGKKEVEISKELVMGKLFIKKLVNLKDEATTGDPKELFKKHNNMVRRFFGELFDIKYEYDYVELNEELTKKGVVESVRREVIDYTMKVSEMEYGGNDFTSQDFYFLLKYSIRIISRLTGCSEAEALAEDRKKKEEEEREEKKRIEKRQEKETEENAKKETKMKKEAEIEAMIEEAEQKRREKEELKKKEEALKEKAIEEEKQKLEKLRQEKTTESEVEIKMVAPKDINERVLKFKIALMNAEKNVKDNNLDDALQNYEDIKKIYDSFAPELKRDMVSETKRLINIYNSLLKVYKDILVG